MRRLWLKCPLKLANRVKTTPGIPTNMCPIRVVLVVTKVTYSVFGRGSRGWKSEKVVEVESGSVNITGALKMSKSCERKAKMCLYNFGVNSLMQCSDCLKTSFTETETVGETSTMNADYNQPVTYSAVFKRRLVSGMWFPDSLWLS